MRPLPDIQLSHLSRFRAEHMGFAMIIIVLFHVALPRTSALFGLRRVGNIGVDIFFFLSGMGLWFSWTREKVEEMRASLLSRWVTFYKRRLKRVYPTWLLIACLYYIPRYNHGWELWGNGHGLVDLAGDILVNWDFWLHDELTFWYIPAIMLLYVLAPPYMELIRRHPVYRWLVVAMIVWPFLVQWITPIHQSVGHIEIFWSRVPIFFLGINFGQRVKEKSSVEGAAWWMVAVVFILTASFCIYMEQYRHGRFPLFLERLVYIPLTVTLLLILDELWQRVPKAVCKAFSWVGAISLEVYLLHVQFVLLPVQKCHLGYWNTFLITMAISLPLAWLLHKAMDKAMKAVSDRGQRQ